eukprot:g71386.t1
MVQDGGEEATPVPRGKHSRKARPVRCIETGEEFPSISAAARSVNSHHQAIMQAISYPCRCAGLHWAYVETE